MILGRRIKRGRHGDYHVRLDREERALLRTLPGQLRDLVSSDDPATRRLFPPAYAADADREAEYRRLMGDDLRERRLQAAAVLEQTADADRLDEEQLVAWLSALNDLRLVLGTRLDVSEDEAAEGVHPDDPRAPGFALYGYLSWLEEQVVEALSGSLPPEGQRPAG